MLSQYIQGQQRVDLSEQNRDVPFTIHKSRSLTRGFVTEKTGQDTLKQVQQENSLSILQTPPHMNQHKWEHYGIPYMIEKNGFMHVTGT